MMGNDPTKSNWSGKLVKNWKPKNGKCSLWPGYFEYYRLRISHTRWHMNWLEKVKVEKLARGEFEWDRVWLLKKTPKNIIVSMMEKCENVVLHGRIYGAHLNIMQSFLVAQSSIHWILSNWKRLERLMPSWFNFNLTKNYRSVADLNVENGQE